MEFTKMEGLGNDFIIIDNRTNHIKEEDYSSLAEKLCDRRFGIGADGIILALQSSEYDIKFRIFNNDGSEAEMCGNGIRCFAKFIYEKEIVKKNKFYVETLAGIIIPEFIFDEENIIAVRVDMGEPVLDNVKIPFISEEERSLSESIKIDGDTYNITTVSMGNPHAVIYVDSLDMDIEKTGKKIENHERFPQKTNVEFVKVESRSKLKMRVWERGVGETLACGTGACAVLVSSHLNELSDRTAIVQLSGGDLSIEWGMDNHIYKTGPALKVFEGYIRI
ncbi:MAG: diaminopimelate epimerase [Desulfobacterales bacterium]|nr:diaminopimelate epimerase [Desulfobacterales bacterium]MCP4160142.1 diaminopimelate epimerase [Deltaproteobacteria bacterium]